MRFWISASTAFVVCPVRFEKSEIRSDIRTTSIVRSFHFLRARLFQVFLNKCGERFLSLSALYVLLVQERKHREICMYEFAASSSEPACWLSQREPHAFHQTTFEAALYLRRAQIPCH